MARHTRLPWAPAAQRTQAAVAVSLSRPRERRLWNMKWKLMSTRSRVISSIFIYKNKIKRDGPVNGKSDSNADRVSGFLSAPYLRRTEKQRSHEISFTSLSSLKRDKQCKPLGRLKFTAAAACVLCASGAQGNLAWRAIISTQEFLEFFNTRVFMYATMVIH